MQMRYAQTNMTTAGMQKLQKLNANKNCHDLKD